MTLLNISKFIPSRNAWHSVSNELSSFTTLPRRPEAFRISSARITARPSESKSNCPFNSSASAVSALAPVKRKLSNALMLRRPSPSLPSIAANGVVCEWQYVSAGAKMQRACERESLWHR